MTMEVVFEIRGPDGTLWCGNNDALGRILGNFSINVHPSVYSTSDTPAGEYTWYRDFPCHANASPWALPFGTNGVGVNAWVSRVNSTTARLTYQLLQPWVNGGSANIVYGYC
jgi:hypothetical protein